MLHQFVAKIRRMRKFQNQRETLITIEISRGALLNNLHNLQKLAPHWQLAPVLKSNAYGHGSNLIADILKEEDHLPFFCIDSYFEAEQLRQRGLNKPLLILGYTPTTLIAKNKIKNLQFVVGSLEQLKILVNKKINQTIQIKFDTGMHRQGIPFNLLVEVLETLQKNTTLKITGVLSHLADAENPNSEITKKQIINWNELAKKMQQTFPTIKYYHLTNSAGLAFSQNIVANVGRSGLALYGINPGNLPINLQPILKMKSVISEIRTIERGETVGYNGTFMAQKQTKVATVPVGYFEGVDRRLANQGFFLVNNKPAPLVGKISMNISTCDISEIKDAAVGTSVIIISDKIDDSNSLQKMAQICGTIPYEILVHLPSHLRRLVVR